ncbi:hypothetical protein D9613_004633 [Agrocybe pediades]|uniref:Uncharacterized protein n=1 Tax=Agrocybe pediades TaxID=84607 RepID=A0A8H4QZG4_9AGAR|nr:hypothetical protein D9613_004633 [Agrocybe pediades]
MSSTTNTSFPYPVAEQISIITSELNSLLLSLFLLGIYTGVFAYTVYLFGNARIFESKRTSRMVPGTIMVQYLATALYVGVDWNLGAQTFCNLGVTRASIFLQASGILDGLPISLSILSGTLSAFIFILGNGLLVWRCFRACGSSLRKVIVPVLLFAVETVSFGHVLNIILDANPGIMLSHVNVVDIDLRVGGAEQVVGALTNIVASVMIYKQICTYTEPRSRIRRQYDYIIDAIISSCAFYTLLVVIQAILNFVKTGPIGLKITLTCVQNYLSRTSHIVYVSELLPFKLTRYEYKAYILQGIAPALMVARLITSSERAGGHPSSSSSATLPSELLRSLGSAESSSGTNAHQNPEAIEAYSYSLDHAEDVHQQEGEAGIDSEALSGTQSEDSDVPMPVADNIV